MSPISNPCLPWSCGLRERGVCKTGRSEVLVCGRAQTMGPRYNLCGSYGAGLGPWALDIGHWALGAGRWVLGGSCAVPVSVDLAVGSGSRSCMPWCAPDGSDGRGRVWRGVPCQPTLSRYPHDADCVRFWSSCCGEAGADLVVVSALAIDQRVGWARTWPFRTSRECGMALWAASANCSHA